MPIDWTLRIDNFPVDNIKIFEWKKKNIMKKVRELQSKGYKVEGKRIKKMMLRAFSDAMMLR